MTEPVFPNATESPAVGFPVQRPVRPLVGCDGLREWLVAQGFRTAEDPLARGNACNWYAYRPSKHQARECECNDGKPMQVVVRPFVLRMPGAPRDGWESAEVDVTGQAGSHWYKLTSYSLSPTDVMGRLHEIEASLIAAWNALRPNSISTTA